MKTIELNRGWHNVNENGDDYVSLPFESPCYGRVSLDLIPEAGAAHAYLDVDGAGGVIDVFVDGECAGTLYGGARRLCDVGKLSAGRSTLSLVMEDGGAIRRGVTLHCSQSDVYVRPYGIFVRTDAADGEKASLTVTVSVTGAECPKRKLALELEVLNARGKRSCRKTKTFVYTGGDKEVVVPVKMRRAYPYETDKPYLYGMHAVLRDENGEALDEADTSFGVLVQGAFEPGGLIGATVPHENGILGDVSHPDAERRKLSALRDLGYNAVRYIGCPSEAALRAADELGLKVIVDIFDNWTYPREGSFSHMAFAFECESRAALAVSVLRNHPSVVMYSAGNKPEESFGRKGFELAEKIFAAVRGQDSSRPVACAFGKLVPTERELSGLGVKRAEMRGKSDAELIGLAEECGLYGVAAEHMLAICDVALCSDGFVPPEGMPYVRIDTPPENAFESLSSAEYDPLMLGDLSPSGTDRTYRGATVAGDIDHTSLPRNSGLYRSMLIGAGGSFILVGGEGSGMLEGRRCWKAQEGESVSVRVFTPGDVVALRRNDYLVGRRLAGKVNRQYASFETEYEDGTLEAVSYLRGREYDIASLKTPSPAQGIALLTGSKRISASAGDISFIDVWVTDGDGNPSVDYDGDIIISAEGEGEIIAMGNEYGRSADEDIVAAVGGHALIAVRGTGEGRYTVRANADGLRGAKIQITVKQ